MAIKKNGKRTGTHRKRATRNVGVMPTSAQQYNANQMRFLLCALKNGLNYAAAYREAYNYKGKNVSVRANLLLRKPGMREILASMAERAFMAEGIDAAQVLGETARIAFANAKDLFDEKGSLIPIQKLPQGVAAAIKGMDVELRVDKDGVQETVIKPRMHDKLKALALLGNNLNIFKAEGQTDVNVNLVLSRMEMGRKRALEARNAERAKAVEATVIDDGA